MNKFNESYVTNASPRNKKNESFLTLHFIIVPIYHSIFFFIKQKIEYAGRWSEESAYTFQLCFKNIRGCVCIASRCIVTQRYGPIRGGSRRGLVYARENVCLL